MAEIGDKYKCNFTKIVDLFINSNQNCASKYLNEIIPEAWNEDPNLFLKLLCLVRDPRNGKGEKEVAYYMFKFLKDNFPETYNKNIKIISMEYGCLKDLLEMAQYKMRDDSTDVELDIFAELLRSDLILETPSLAGKWAPRERNQYNKLSRRLSEILFPGKKNSLELYRKEILKPLGEKINIVEQKMCDNKWNEINLNEVPLGAIKKYGKFMVLKNNYQVPGAFIRHNVNLDQFESNKISSDNKKGYQKIIDDILKNGITEINFKALVLLLNKYTVSIHNNDLDDKITYDLLDESKLEYNIEVDEEDIIQHVNSEQEHYLDKETFLDEDSLIKNENGKFDLNNEWVIL